MTTKKVRAKTAAEARLRPLARMGVWFVLLLLAGPGRARGDAPREVGAAEFRAEVARLEGVVAACGERAAACNAAGVGAPVILRAGGASYAVRWDWLAAALEKAKQAAGAKDARAEKIADAREDLDAAAARLREEASLVGGDGRVSGGEEDDRLPDAGAARKQADAVLARKEFRLVEGQSYLAQKLAAFFLFLDEVFSRLGNMLPHSPAIGQALEWAVLGLAAAGLLLWAWRVNQRGKLELIAKVDTGERVWREEAERWAERAEAEAGRGDWREAVHCLYWSAIVMGEGQGLWRQNRARTPREYVRLLEPGTARQASLRKLTGVFERIWYGLRPAGEGDFRQAKTWLEELRAG